MSGGEVGGTSESCQKQLLNARWATNPVKCGDSARMLADTVNIPAGTPATFAVKELDNSTITTENANTEASSVEGEWISEKTNLEWNGGEVKFKVATSGLTADSQEDHLSFHRYPDIARASLSGRMSSPPGSASPRFGWDKKVYIEFTDRKLTLTVKVHLINRTQPKPEREKKESLGDYRTRCNNVPVGGPVPDAAKQDIKTTVESVYIDQWDVHRDACQRGDDCSCDRIFKCCIFELEVILELVETSGSMIHEVNLWPQSGRANSSNWHRIESRPGKSWAHEVGHLMGFYDEYAEGATGSPPWQPSVPASIMGSGTTVFDYHIEEFRAWFSSQIGETFNLVRYS